MAKQLIKICNSVGLTLPTNEVKRLNLKPGDKVEIYSDGKSMRIIPAVKIRAVKIGGLCKGESISEEDIAEVRREMWGKRFS
ncbi:MAG: AbrB/MazE/SpoVT family DNA-binding domain-containing protein [Deltaproteobacteria bacterium]|nr:AbrB/MazE/SpoVT family DNA-binding domain-containing protein [Deltaproteobacteria bacterium]